MKISLFTKFSTSVLALGALLGPQKGFGQQVAYGWIPQMAGSYKWEDGNNWTVYSASPPYPSNSNAIALMLNGLMLNQGTQTIEFESPSISINCINISGGDFTFGKTPGSKAILFADTFDMPGITVGQINYTNAIFNTATSSLDASDNFALTTSLLNNSSLTLNSISGMQGNLVLNSGSFGTVVVNGTGLPSSYLYQIQGGTLQLNVTGIVNNAIQNSGTVILSPTAPTLYNGSISDYSSAGSVIIDGGQGAVFNMASNTYTGQTTVRGNSSLAGTTSNIPSTGGLVINSGSTVFFVQNGGSGTYSGSVIANGSLNIQTLISGTFALSSTLSGAGSLTITNSTSGGNTTISNNNTTFTGTTTIDSAATLALSTSGSLPASNVTVTGTLNISGTTSGATLASLGGSGTVTLGSKALTVSGSTSSTFSGIIGGTGTLTKGGASTLTLTGNNTYSGGTTLSAGGLIVSATSLPTAVATSSGSTLTFHQSASDGTYALAITGAGVVQKTGSYKLTLTSASNSYSGGTTVISGTLQGDTSSLQGNITNNAAVIFDGAGTYTGLISGTGSVTKINSGTLTFSNATTQSYTGTTYISAGTLSLSGTAALSSPVNVSTGATLTIASTTTGASVGPLSGGGTVTLSSKALTAAQGAIDSTFAGVIGGTGTVTKTGTGALTLSGANTYTGTTTISAGSLLVTGSLANTAVTVSSGGTLGGTGTIGSSSASVSNGGTVSPGSSPGTLTINGSYTQTSAGSLNLELQTPTLFDQLVVNTGSVTLAGTLNLILPSSHSVFGTHTFTLIDNTAGSGVSGTFGTVNRVNFPPLSAIQITYNANTVVLTQYVPHTPVTPRHISALPIPISSTARQTINDFSRRLNKIRPVWKLSSSEPEMALYAQSSSLSFEPHYSGERVQPETPSLPLTFIPTMDASAPSASEPSSSPKAELRRGGNSCCTQVVREKPWGVFADAVGSKGHSYGDDTHPGFTFYSIGAETGFDYVGPYYAVGLSPAYQDISGHSIDRTQSFHISSALATAYATVVPIEDINFFIDFIGGGGYQWYSLKKSTAIGELTGTPQGGQLYLYTDAGLAFLFCNQKGQFLPFAGLGYVQTWTDGFEEAGGGAKHDEQAFAIGPTSMASLRTVFGFSLSYERTGTNYSLIPELRASWQWECLDPNGAVSYSSAPLQVSSQLQLVGSGKNLLVGGGQVRFLCPTGTEIYGSYDYEWSSTFHDHLLLFGVEHRF